MGTRYEDQPADHWAGPESLDPTPVWKQYLVVALLLFGGLIAVLVVSLLAILPQIVTPPALVAGDRLVLPMTELPAAGAPKRIGPPLVDDARAFWLSRPPRAQAVALRARWAPRVGGTECDVEVGGPNEFVAKCADGTYRFDFAGSATSAPRALDQYLVSVSDDRLIVNLSRLIRADERVPAPSQP
jgi:hypothetical protein